MKKFLSVVTIMTLMAVSAQAATVWWCGTRYEGGNGYYTNGLSWKQSGVDAPYGTPPQSVDAYGLINNGNGDHVTMPIINSAISNNDVPQLLGVGSDAPGTLTVTNGGSITAINLAVGRGQGTAELIISAGTMTVSGDTSIAADGTVSGIVELNNGGTLNLQIPPEFGSAGGSVINIYGFTAKLIIAGDVTSYNYIQENHIAAPASGENIAEVYNSDDDQTEYTAVIPEPGFVCGLMLFIATIIKRKIK